MTYSETLRKLGDSTLGVSLGLLWSLEAFLEPPGALLAASWSLLERSWGSLGASWAPLGPSSRRQRRPKCDKDNMPKNDQLPDPSTQFPPPLWDSILGPKIDQNRTQNESKFKTNFKSEKVALQEPLGAVLGSSWGILGAILGSKKTLRYWKT